MSETDINAVVVKKTEFAPGLMILRVRPDSWSMPDFKAGQYVAIGLPWSAKRVELSDPESPPSNPDQLIKRAYSIASSSKQKEYVELYITLVRSGSLTPRLFALKEGDGLFMSIKFKGMFTLDQVSEEMNLALVATGTGIAPYMSMIRTTFMADDTRKFAVLHGARHSWDLGYRAELVTLSYYCKNFSYQPIISRPDDEKEGWTGDTGYVQDLWDNKTLERAWGEPPKPDNTHIFLCGAPAMIETMVAKLEAEGFKEHKKKDPGQIHVERFW